MEVPQKPPTPRQDAESNHSRARLWTAIFAVLILANAYQFWSAYRGMPVPTKPLAVSVRYQSGHLVIGWDQGALKDSRNATVSIRDGGIQSTINLDRQALDRGSMEYAPVSGNVQITMTAPPAQGGVTFISAGPELVASKRNPNANRLRK